MLNSSQQRAVGMTDGPCLIIAGAGTGKTKTIVEKIVHLLESGIDPTRILALTFSNEAADQLKNRAVELNQNARLTHISTFHSFCADFIRQHAKECGVSDNFTIMEELDAAILLKKELDLDTGTALRYANTISKAKDLGITINDYRNYLSRQESTLSEFFPKKNWETEYQRSLVRVRTMHLDTIKEKGEKEKLTTFVAAYDKYSTYLDFVSAWIQYEKFKKDRRSLDYADLNRLVLDYVQTYGHAALSSSFDYIIVDEFQDTNKVQFQLLQHLTAMKKNITVVGDQNQTVYAFRGAYANNIEKFKTVFDLAEDQVVNLETNYRSTDKILRTAHKLIRNNYDDPSQSILLRSHDDREGDKVRVIHTIDPREQARRIIEEIETLTKSGLSYRDIAILYRSHNSASPIKRALSQRGIPYSVTGGTEFFYQPEIKAVVAYLYVLNNFSNPLLQADQAWWKLMHGRYGLSAADSTLLAEYKKKKKTSLQSIIYHQLEYTGMSKDGKERIRKLTHAIDELRNKKHHRLSDLILAIFDSSGIPREYDSKEQLSNLRRLHNMATAFETFHGDDLQSFIAYVELVDEIGGLPSERFVDEESVKLMTIHAAKGLEFSAVFVVDMVRDKFPLTRGGAEPFIPIELNEQYNEILSRSYKDDREKEKALKEFTSNIKIKEERRLAYVALTRAKQNLFLTSAKDYGGEPRDPSQFLVEIGVQPEWFSKPEVAAAEDLSFEVDRELKFREGGDSELDRAAASQKRLMTAAMERRDLYAAQFHMMIYHSLLDGKPVGDGPAAAEAAKILENIANNNSTGLRFNPNAIAFSVTSLGTYAECPKKYELKEVLKMPSRDDEDTTVLGFGSAIHEMLDKAAKIKSNDELDKILAEKFGEHADPLDVERAKRILEVFWQRNKSNILSTLATEKYFRFNMDGFLFSGKIDRIDNLGDGRVRIVDYKTGYVNYDVAKEDRERQLILYALAIQNSPEFAGMKPVELVLDMLEKEKPLEFMLDNGVMAPKEGRIKPVSLEEVRKSIVETARNIALNYEKGFPVAQTDAPCRFCSYKLYCPKWE